MGLKAVTITSTGTGGFWDTASTWVGGNVPAVTDDVVIANGATVTTSGYAECVNLTINGTLTINATDQLVLNGDFTNNGTFNAAAGDVSFTANTTLQTISGNATSFNTISINKGTTNSNILNVTSVITMISDGLTITNGTFKLSSTSTIDIFVGNYTLTSTCGLWNNGGTMTLTDGGSLLLQGILRNSSGTINIGSAANEHLSYVTGSTITVEGGNVNITGSLKHNAGADLTTYSQSGGTFTCGIFGTTVGNRGVFDISNTGSSFSMSDGTIVVVTMNGSYGGADLFISASTFSVTGGNIQIGNSSTPASQIININSTVPFYNFNVMSTNSPVARLVANTLEVINNVTIGSGSTLDANTEDMLVGGNWNNNGTFTNGNQRVTFNLGNSQTINGANTFSRVTINKTANEVTLNNNQIIANQMTFTSGIVRSVSNNLIFNDGATVSGATDVSHFVGFVTKIGNSAFTFPTGNGLFYASIRIGAPTNNTDEFTARYYSNAYAITDTFIGLNNVSNREHWILNRTVGTSNVAVTLSFSSHRPSLVDSSQLADLRVARWNGTEWVSQGNGGTVFGTPSGTVRTTGTVSSFSPFTLGSSLGLNPLPVNWLNFNAKIVSENQVDLNWTVNEIENTTFLVQKSLNGKDWFQIGKVENTIAMKENGTYRFSDMKPVKGMQYYRIEEMVLNVHQSYSDIAPILLNSPSISDVSIYPNPAGNFVNVSLPTDEPASLVLYNATGQKLLELNSDSGNALTIDLTEYEKGVYFFEIISNDIVISREKMIKL